MRELVLETIQRFRMILPGERVAVACSGGVDSTALLLLLRELSDSLGCVVSVAHFNHLLRGEESDSDEKFVSDLAGRFGLPFYAERADVRNLARAARANQESKARELRYKFFRKLVASGKADRVAVAHTMDDQAETVLFRLLRGAGTRGLMGIQPVVGEEIIRPLLEVRRAALCEWLTARQEPWREDASNQDPRYARNRIRHDLLPRLTQFNPCVVETLAHTAEVAREEELFWREYLQPMLKTWVRTEETKVVVDLEALRKAPTAVAYRILRWAIARTTELPGGASRLEGNFGEAPNPADFGHVQQLLRWVRQGQSGQTLALPQRITARREFQHLILMRAEGVVLQASDGYFYRVEVPSTVEVPEIRSCFRFELIPFSAGQPRYNEIEAVLLDSKVAHSPLILRNWRAGDAYLPPGHRKPRKLQDLFQRKRIPLRERAGWPVLVAGERLIWVRGWAVGEAFSPASDSRQAIRLCETRRS
jgi:tRNA(Ile)-lysidine synthase